VRNAFQVRSMIEREAILHFMQQASDEDLAEIEAQHRAILARAESTKPDPCWNTSTTPASACWRRCWGPREPWARFEPASRMTSDAAALFMSPAGWPRIV
jgi:hypothetical protein